MMLAKKSCEKEVLTESKLSPLALSSSLMSAATIDECLPAAAAPVTPIILSIKKPDDECLPAAAAPVTPIMLSVEKSKLLGTLNEERKQVTAHTNLTQHASINDCVRYFDNGKEKQERDDSSEQKALNDDKCKVRRSPQACKQKK